MHDFLALLVTLLERAGPWIIFIAVFAETAVFVGLLIPAEATVLLGAFLADRGVFSLESVVAATFIGGLLGDHTGYWLGRRGGRRITASEGRLGRMWRRYEGATGRLFRLHAALAITLARFISFVRTLMPWFAGMSGVPYGRFFVYDLLGVTGWAAASIALGYAAGESWRLVAERLGEVSAAIVMAMIFVGVLVALRTRRRKRRELRRGLQTEAPGAGAAEHSGAG